MKKALNQQSKYEWIWYVLGYLSIARISLEKLKNDQYPKKDPGEKLAYYDKFVLLAVIWNIKHALELIIKHLGLMVDKTYLQSHNSEILIKDLTKRIKSLKIYKPEKIDELAKIINKYYRLEFLGKEFFIDKNTLDVKNSLFRYPNNSIDVGFVNQITVEEIDELLKDIEFVRRLRAILDISLQAKGKAKT